MEDMIKYEEETITEEVFNGEIDINEKRSSKQERTHAFEIFKKATSQNINKSEYKIEWLDEDFESNKKHFRVLHTYKKKVPYKVSYEMVYKGEYYLVDEKITPEEFRSQIFNLLREEGYAIDNEEDYEIVTKDEDNEVSQKIDFVVYHSTKERIDEEEISEDLGEKAEEFNDEYREMVDLKHELESTTDPEKLEELSGKVDELLNKVDGMIEKKIQDYGIFETKISNYSKKIEETEEEIRAKKEEYQKAFEESQEIMAAREGLSEEEIDSLQRKKDIVNRKLSAIKSEEEALKRRLKNQKAELSAANRDLEMARMLGISAKEYQEISKGVKTKGMLEAIIEKKGLTEQLEEILSIPYRKRTKEQKRVLDEAKNEILTEIANYKKENTNTSVLESIQALYGVDLDKVKTDGQERVILVKPEKYKNMVKNADALPHKVGGKTEVNYVPNEGPKDLEEAFDFKKGMNNVENEEAKEAVEKITIFKDKDHPNRYYVRKPVFSRFGVIPAGNVDVRINGTMCRAISAEDVENKIKGSKTRDVSPFEIEEVEAAVTIPEVTDLVPAEYYDLDRIFEQYKPKEDQTTEEVTDLVPVEEKTTDLVPIEKKVTDLVPIPEKQLTEKITSIEEAQKALEGAKIALKMAESDLEDLEGLSAEEIINLNQQFSNAARDVETAEKILEEAKKAYEITQNKGKEDTVEKQENNNKNNLNNEVTDLTIYDDKKLEDILKQYVGKEEDVVKVTENTIIDGKGQEDEEIINSETDQEEFHNENNDVIEKITIFRDENNPNRYYVRKPVFARFGIAPEGNVDVRINGTMCRSISKKAVQFIKDNVDNPALPTPYFVDEVVASVNIETVKNDITDDKNKSNKPTGNDIDTDDIVDEDLIDDNDKKPEPKDNKKPKNKKKPKEKVVVVPEKKPQPTEPKEKTPKAKPTVPVQKETTPKAKPTQPVQKPTEPKAKPTVPVQKPTTPVVNKHKPHVEEIIAKLTQGLDIHANDGKKYKASNIKVAKGFKQELSSGNYLYNIVHFVPAIIKFPLSLVRKGFNALTLTSRGKQAMEIFKTRLDNLSEEELEVLFSKYKGSQLKTDMNYQINPLIMDRLRQYGLARVEKLNETIKKDYNTLFICLGKLKAIEHELGGDIGSAEKKALEDSRNELNKQAASVIREIISCREEADTLLSSGVHGLEEDFKAVSTKLSYVGMRFGKKNNFDNKLQEQLGNYGRNLNIALENNNDEAIVQNFMGLESCYYDNTEIRGSLVGKRSVGTKYYSPLAEQFDYRDDPFIRDIFTTAAVAGATLSAINAFRTNQVVAEHNRLLEEHNKDVEEINRINDETMYYVNETGKQISFRKFPFRDGMEANAKQDILTNAAVRERAHLDQTNWQFNDTYHQIDPAGHDAYNLFNQDVTSRIDQTAIEYANGTLPYDDLFARVSQISTDAHATLTSVVDESLAILRQYAASHPQFDLSAFEQSMQYLVEHPEAVANMNQAMVDVVNMGESLSSLQAAHLEALSMLPVEMSSNIIGAASASVLASTVASTLSRGPKKKTKYGNEVTDMMDEYMKSREEEEETEKTK